MYRPALMMILSMSRKRLVENVTVSLTYFSHGLACLGV